MQKLIRNLLPLFAVLIAAMASAQGVTWQSKVEPLEGNAYRIVLEATVPSGYHMYDLGPYEGGGTVRSSRSTRRTATTTTSTAWRSEPTKGPSALPRRSR